MVVLFIFACSGMNGFDIPLFLFLVTLASLWSRNVSDLSTLSLCKRGQLLAFTLLVFIIK